MTRTVTALDELDPQPAPSAVTIGKFDGVHLGHRRLLDVLRERAQAQTLHTAVVTFDRHPYSVVSPERMPEPLCSPDQQRELIAALEVDTLLVLPFDEHLRALSAEDFVERVLVTGLNARVVLVGGDFRFGAGGRGDVALLRALGEAHGFAVEVVDDVQTGGRRVSSSLVREMLGEGRIEEAAALLGRDPAVRGVVVHGARRGRELGYPTANLPPQPEGFIPADGVYVADVLIDGVTYPAAVSVGNNPTFEGVAAKQVEAYLLDVDLDLYDRVVEVRFQHRIRGMVSFDSIDELIERMALDVQCVREHVAARSARGRP